MIYLPGCCVKLIFLQAPTRYIVNDACVINGKTLVSGSALKFDGQLTVYNYQNETACYRCLYPTAPPAGKHL